MQSQVLVGCNVWLGGPRRNHMLGPHRWVVLGTGDEPSGIPSYLVSHPFGSPISLGIPSPQGSHLLWAPIPSGYPIPLVLLFPRSSHPLGYLIPASLGLSSPWVSCPFQALFPLGLPSPLGFLPPLCSHPLGAPVSTSHPVLFPPRSPSSITLGAAGTTPVEGPSSDRTG